jgi:hypothetical protein
MAPPTIIAHKSTFINAQTLHLSQPLEPSAAWRAANEGAQGGLPARVVDDAVYRLNHLLTQHARRVYAPQASRHVAEQIEGLFHAEAQGALRASEDDDEGGEGEEGGGRGGEMGEKRSLRVGADFSTSVLYLFFLTLYLPPVTNKLHYYPQQWTKPSPLSHLPGTYSVPMRHRRTHSKRAGTPN